MSLDIFIVGFPFAAADRVAAKLLKEGNRVSLLVPEQFILKARALKKRFGDSLTIFKGKPDCIDFGLSGEEYKKLLKNTRTMMVLPSSFFPSSCNIERIAREMVEFCLNALNFEQLIYLSCIDAAGKTSKIFCEKDLALSFEFLNRDAEHRAKNERILSRFKKQIPITIVRTGIVLGTGFGLYPVIPFLLLSNNYQNAPSLERIAFTPIADLVDFIAWLTRNPVLKTVHFFHVLNKTPQKLSSEISIMAKKNFSSHYNIEQAALRYIKKQGFSLKSFWQNNGYTGKVQNSWSNNFLAEHKIKLPVVTEEVWAELTGIAVKEF
jgi:hypothetical protein